MKIKSSFLFILICMILLSTIFPLQKPEEVAAADISQIGIAYEHVVVRVYYDDMKDIELLSDFDLFEFNNTEEKYVLVAIETANQYQIEALGFKVVIDEEETKQFNFLMEFSVSDILTIPGYECYRTVEETYATAQQLANSHPTLASWIDVGDSWEKSVGRTTGYDMMVLKITNQAIQAEKPKLFIIAAIHAREYTTAEVALRYAEYLLNNYNSDADVTWVVDHHEIHIMFQANPDGRKEAEAGRSWRKNTNENYCGATSTNRGADLNRNFSYHWGGAGASQNQCSGTYRGPQADSEPETRAISDYMELIFPDQRDTGAAPDDTTGVFIDLHTFGEYVLWPWGYTNSSPPNDSQLQTLGRKFAYFNGYRPGQTGQDLYTCSGVTTDFAYGELGIAAYTFEMGTVFFQGCTSFENTIAPDNLNALLYAGKVVRTPYMTSLGPDALSLMLSADSVYAGETPALTATINDTRYEQGYGAEPVQNISQAEYYIDTPPWMDGAVAIPMAAADGAFNSNVENVTALINTSGLSQGRHIIFVRGLDQAGNWGAFSAIFLVVEHSDNNPPVADDLTLTVKEDYNWGVMLSGTDPDGDPLTFRVVDPPAHGALSGTIPNLLYTPYPDYNGADSFTYVANDGMLDSALATVSITVLPVNDAPVADPIFVTTAINQSVEITLTGSDLEGDDLYFLLVTLPSNGTISGLEPFLTYTPDLNFVGEDTFTYKAVDGMMDSNYATVTVTVNPPGPVRYFWDDFETDLGWVRNPDGTDTATLGLWERAIPQQTNSSGVKQLANTVSGSYDLVTGPLAGSGAGSYDIDGGETSIQSPQINLPTNSQLTLSFWYYLAHGSNSSSADYLRLSVIGDNTTQIFEELGAANNDNAAWEQFSADISQFAGQSVRIHIAAADASSASLVEAAIDDVLIEGTVTNTPPVAEGQSISTDEDNPVAITLTGSDVDGDPLSFEVTIPPEHGILSGAAPELVYTPDLNFNGNDAFSFVANDGMADSVEAVVSIAVAAVNDAPVVDNNLILVLDEDTAIDFVLPVSDVDNDLLTLIMKTNLSSGTLSGEMPNLTYTPDHNFHGIDGFTFTVSDGIEESNLGEVSFTINSVNDKPIANPMNFSIPEDYQYKFTLDAFDADSDPLTYIILSQPEHGELIGEGPSFRYVAAENYWGPDSFDYKVNDGHEDSDPATVSIYVYSQNDAPVAIPQNLSTAKDTPLNITLSGEDIDGDPLTFYVTEAPLHGTLSGTAPDLIYTPEDGYVGMDVFTFVVYDVEYWDDSAQVNINVYDTGNSAPVADPLDLSLREDIPREIFLSGSDPDGDLLTFAIDSQPEHGTLSGQVPNVLYTPDLDYSGPDSFTFTVSDGIAVSAPASVLLTIRPENDAPIADPQSLVTKVNTPIDITLTGSDIEGDSIYMLLVTLPKNGTLSGLEPNLTYTPNQGFVGIDSFTFKTNDGSMDSIPATIQIVVEPTFPYVLFFDDFETDKGWVVNPFRTDNAHAGKLERADPEPSYYFGYKQLGETVSGTHALVTGPLAGNRPTSHDVSGGTTSVRSPLIVLPEGRDLTLSFSYYFAHASNATSADYIRVKVVGRRSVQILQELGARNDDDAKWQTFTYNLSGFAGQTVYIHIQVADLSLDSLIEAAIDDVLIIAE